MVVGMPPGMRTERGYGTGKTVKTNLTWGSWLEAGRAAGSTNNYELHRRKRMIRHELRSLYTRN